MTQTLRARTAVLFLGDIFFFTLALWLSLYLRAFEVPPQWLFIAHLKPFSFLFLVGVAIFFIAGLYESRSIILARRAFSATLLVTQIVNVAIAALFFFFIPAFGIAPKVILFIYLIVSFLLILVWRVYLFPRLGIQKQEKAIVVGVGPELQELIVALNHASRAPAHVVSTINPEGDVRARIKQALAEHKARIVIADFNDERVAGAFPELYNLLPQGVRFFDSAALYEEVFGRILLSKIDDRWVARNISRSAHIMYDTLKRMIDFVAAIPLSIVLFICYPIFALIIKLQDGGPVLYRQVRTGQNNTPFVMYKFRSMSGTDQGNEVLKSKHVVTSFGKLMRVTRLDEFPQVWNLLKGDLSLIGPRPEFPALVNEYAAAIPYYDFRHLIKPGLSGWAQLYHDNHPHHGTDIEATSEKLSYDLYYLKHRSILLDLTIALKTIKKLLTRSGV